MNDQPEITLAPPWSHRYVEEREAQGMTYQDAVTDALLKLTSEPVPYSWRSLGRGRHIPKGR